MPERGQAPISKTAAPPAVAPPLRAASAWPRRFRLFREADAVNAAALTGHAIDRQLPGNVEQASLMYGGQFSFAGATVRGTPGDIFKLPNSSAIWRKEIMSLDWLGHFLASPKHLHAQYAMRLIAEWHAARPRFGDAAQHASALYKLCITGPALASRVDPQFQAALIQAITANTHRLANRSCRSVAEKLAVGLALLAATIVVRTAPNIYQQAIGLLGFSLPRIVLPDGGHVSGDPEQLLALTNDMVALKTAIKVARLKSCAVLNLAVERALAMLHMLQRPDGTLAFTEDSATQALPDVMESSRQQGLAPIQDVGACPALEVLLTQNSCTGDPQSLAPHSAYARLDEAKSCLLAQYGADSFFPGKPAYEFHHAGVQIFQLSNLLYADTPPLRCQDPNLIKAAEGSLLRLRFINDAGYGFERSCYLAHNGEDLRVEDRFFGPERPLHVALGIVSSARLSATRNGDKVIIVFANGQTWQLSVRGAMPRVSPGGDGIFLVPEAGIAEMNWALKKIRKQPRHPASAAASLDLPFA